MGSDLKSEKSLTKHYARIASQRDSIRDRRNGDDDRVERARRIGYSPGDIENIPDSVLIGLGCTDPTALAGLKDGETVLDLGCGGGLDAFIESARVGPTGTVIGVDRSPAMIRRATDAVERHGYAIARFVVDSIESLPVVGESIDVVLSDCVMNHCRDLIAAIEEPYRILRAGGRMHVADLVTMGQVPPPDAPGLEIWAEWLAVGDPDPEHEARDSLPHDPLAVALGVKALPNRSTVVDLWRSCWDDRRSMEQLRRRIDDDRGY